MSNISDTFEDLELQGTEYSGLISLIKSTASKNITLSDWDTLIHEASMSAADIARLYTLLKTILPAMDSSIVSHETSINSHEDSIKSHENSITALESSVSSHGARIGEIETDVADAVRKSLDGDATQHITGTVSTDAIISGSASFKNLTVHDPDIGGSTQIGSNAISTNTLSTSTLNVTDSVNLDSDSALSFADDDSTDSSVPTHVKAGFVKSPLGGFGEVETRKIYAPEGNILNLSQHASVGNFDVDGDLNIKGSLVSQIMETLFVKDNIIVTNSSGAEFSTSGIVIRIPPDENAPNSPSNSYGILYVPGDDVVKIGKGALTEIRPDGTGEVTYTFGFTEDEAFPLAARSGFDERNGYVPKWDSNNNVFVPSLSVDKIATKSEFEESSDGHIPQWDSEKNEFVPSTLSANDIATKASVEALRAEIGDLENFFNELNNGGTES